MIFCSKFRVFMTAVMLACIAAIFIPCRAFAGLACPTADLEIDNLRIGQVYNLTQMGSMPYKITSTFMQNRVQVTLLNTTTGECMPGFEPVPDMTWVSISKDNFVLMAGETGSADIVIRIPNDEKYLGHKYQMKILAKTVPMDSLDRSAAAVVGVGVLGALKFTIAPRALTEEEKKKFEKAKYKLVNIELTPNDLPVEDVPIGKNVDVEKEKGTFLKLVNTGDEPVKVRIKSLQVSETGIIAPPGWENTPNPSFLSFPKEKLKINPLEIKKLPFSISFPKDEKYRGKKYFFVVEVYVEDELIKTSYRSKIYVSTR